MRRPGGAFFATPSTGSRAIAAYEEPFSIRADRSDETAALQDAIYTAQAQRRQLIFPPGDICHRGLTISAGLNMRGQGREVTRLVLMSGSSVPAVGVAVPATVAPLNGYSVEVGIRDMSITSPNASDAPGIGFAHGLSLIATSDGGAFVRLSLDGLTIGAVPGDGIRALGWKGFVESYGTNVCYNYGNGIRATSVTDWRMFGGDICGAGIDGVVLGQTEAMIFDGLNVYVNGGNDFRIVDSNDTRIGNSTIDITSKNGILLANSTGGRLVLSNNRHRWAGSSAPPSGTVYADLYMASNNTGHVYAALSAFDDPQTSTATNKPAWSIYSQSGNTGKVHNGGHIIFGASGAPASVVNDVSVLV